MSYITPAPTRKLRPYQLEALEAIATAHDSSRSVDIEVATGLGKTTIFTEYARRQLANHPASKVLACVHKIDLCEQAEESFLSGGMSTAIERANLKVDPFMLPNVTIGCIATMKGKRLERFAPSAFSLIIIDEHHHAACDSYQRLMAHFSGAKVLGVSATPTPNKVSAREAHEKLFPTRAYTMSLADGIDGGWLAQLRFRDVEITGLDMTSVKIARGDFDSADLERVVAADAITVAIKQPLIDEIGSRQTIVFCVSRLHAHRIAEALREGGVTAEAIDSETPLGERAKLFERYRSRELQVLTNVMVLTEGTDLPDTSCVAIMCPTRNRSKMLQQIGRGTRLAPGKSDCLVLSFIPGVVSRVMPLKPADAVAMERRASKASKEYDRPESAVLDMDNDNRVVHVAAKYDVQDAQVMLRAERIVELGRHLRSMERGRVSVDAAVRGKIVDELAALSSDEQRDMLLKRAALPSLKQQKQCRRYGLDPLMPRYAAGKLMGMLVESKWQKTEDIRRVFKVWEVAS